MRLNAHEYLGLGRKQQMLMNRVQVWMNGQQVKDCVIADEEAGYVVRYQRRADGLIAADEHGEAITERVYGLVRIFDPQVAAP